jgi:hypothetical protein
LDIDKASLFAKTFPSIGETQVSIVMLSQTLS